MKKNEDDVNIYKRVLAAYVKEWKGENALLQDRDHLVNGHLPVGTDDGNQVRVQAVVVIEQ